MSTLSEDYIKEIMSKVATKLELKSWRHSMQKLENIGQNYFGIIMPVTLSGQKNDNSYFQIEILLKLAPIDERYRISGAVTIMFRREMFVYSVLLKKYQEIKIWPPYIVPTLYFLRDEYCKEVIAMKNMGEDKYEPYTQKTFLDLDHIIIALKSLAKLHAMSFILKENDSMLYSKVEEVCLPLLESTNKRFFEVMTDRLTKALSKFEGSQYEPLFEYLKLHCSLLFDKAVKLAKGTCICHGDIWKENILFKYESCEQTISNDVIMCKRPVSACLIDYQTVRVSSPAFDLLYLIISSTNTDLRQNNYYSLLRTYYETFSTVIEQYKIDSKGIYSRQDLDHDLKLVAPSCLITANTALWLSSGLQQEGHVRSKLVLTTPEETAVAVNNYKSAVRGIVDDLYSYGYLPVDFEE